MIQDDEIRRFLEIDQADGDDLERYLGDPPNGTLVAILQTSTDGSYPTVANCFYKCTVINGLSGNEREGDSWSVSGGSGASVYAANLGSAVPPFNTYVLGVRVPDRWVFIYNG